MQKEERNITLRDGERLSVTMYENEAKTWLIVTHGIGEHRGRHEYLQELFVESFNLFYYDLRGHGKSSGKRAYVERFEDYIEDLSECIAFLQEYKSMQRYTLFGHSMGALITCGFAQTKMKSSLMPQAIFVNAPPVGISGILGKLVNMIPDTVLTKLASLHVSFLLSGMVNLKLLSHDPSVKQEYSADRYNLMKLHSHLLLELIRFSREVFSKPINPEVKSFCSYGSMDKIIDVKALEKYFTDVENSFELHKIEGAYHEIHNESKVYQREYFRYLVKRMMEISV